MLRTFRPGEGVGNAGCPVHPQPRVRWGSKKMHTSIHSGRTGNHPASPHAMVLTASFVISPAIGFLATVVRKLLDCKLDASVEASGPHDFSVRDRLRQRLRRAWYPSDEVLAKAEPGALVSRAARVHRIPPRVCDDGQRPSCGTGRRGYEGDLRFRKTRIFFQMGLDNPNHVDPAGEIRFQAQIRGARWVRSNQSTRWVGSPAAQMKVDGLM